MVRPLGRRNRLRIELGIPIPPWPVRKYPLGDLAVGESMAFPIGDRRSLQVVASRHGAQHGKKFTCRSEGDEVRVWRTE